MSADIEQKAILSEIRKYRPEDKEQVLALIGKVWGEKKQEDYQLLWDWKARWAEEVPTEDDGHCPRVATREGKIIGYLGVIPCRLKIGSHLLRAGFGTETFTDPDHRGTGIRLMRTMLSETQVVLGSANERTTILWAKLSKLRKPWIRNVVKYVHIIDPAAFLRSKGFPAFAVAPARLFLSAMRSLRTIPARRKRGYTVQLVTHFDPEIDAFCTRFADQHENLQLRDSDYLNWRFTGCPLPYTICVLRYEGEICGYCVSRLGQIRGRKAALLVEMLATGQREQHYQMLAEEVLRYAVLNGVSDVQTIDSGCPAMRKALRRCLFIRKPEQQLVMLWINREKGFPDSDREGAYDESRWFLTMGDGDFELVYFDQHVSDLIAQRAVSE